MIAVVIPFYNKWTLTHQRLRELYNFIPPDTIEIILINDASTELECETGIAWWQKQVQHHKIRYKKNKKNLGFGGSMNVGAKIAIKYEADIIVFLSNDVKIYGNFIAEMVSAFAEKPNSLMGGEVIYWDGGWNSFTIKGKKTVIPYANGWLLACTSEVWATLDGFDSIYRRYDYEDIDLSTQALAKGYDIIGLNSKNVEHLHQGTTISTLGVDRMSHTKKNREIYKAKWLHKIPEIIERQEHVQQRGKQ